MPTARDYLKRDFAADLIDVYGFEAFTSTYNFHILIPHIHFTIWVDTQTKILELCSHLLYCTFSYNSIHNLWFIISKIFRNISMSTAIETKKKYLI